MGRVGLDEPTFRDGGAVLGGLLGDETGGLQRLGLLLRA